MEGEFDIKKAIQTAIQMEKDGYSFYKKAASQTSSDMGRSIFEGIADDELIHLDIFQKMLEDKIEKSEWDNLVNSSQKYADLPIFPKDLKSVEGANPETNELDALNIAMDGEKKAVDYYTKIKEGLADEAVIDLIDKIIEQEKNHYMIFEEEFNYLNRTGFWYGLDIMGQ